MVQRIAIYAGPGVGASFPLKGLLITPEELINSNWDQTFDLLIMPGGRDKPYHAALQGKGNAKIRSFVERGGTYIGICAGAYYGCKMVDFDRGEPLEVCEERELAFFSGSAIGPAYGKGTFDYGSQKGARAAKLQTDLGAFHAYFNGGCYFSGDFSQVRILARYLDLEGQPPAILECPIGKGKAILSGVHLETSSDSLDPKDPIVPILQKSEEPREQFWLRLLARPFCLERGHRSDESGDGKSSVLSLAHCS